MRLAARGQRDADTGVTETLADPWLVAQLKRQAREVHIEAVLVAAILTSLGLLVPGS